MISDEKNSKAESASVPSTSAAKYADKEIDLAQLRKFIHDELHRFNESKLNKLNGLDLVKIIRRKNPYLYRYKNFEALEDLVKALVDATLSSSDETLFGVILERVAIKVCEQSFGGRKSMVEGIDLEFDRDNIRYIVSIKSGPNWGNSDQKKRMKQHFTQARRIFQQGGYSQMVRAIEGCCYGQTSRMFNQGDYQKLCGREFWQLISGNRAMYQVVLDLIAEASKDNGRTYKHHYNIAIMRITDELSSIYIDLNGDIDWSKILEKNSTGISSNFVYGETTRDL